MRNLQRWSTVRDTDRGYEGGVVFLVDTGIDPLVASLDDAVGYKFPWLVYFLQVRLREGIASQGKVYT